MHFGITCAYDNIAGNTMDCAKDLPKEVLIGIELFNQGNFFEAHEFLEISWRAETDDIRFLYQGILQLGVGYYHLQKGNKIGANSVLEKAKNNLISIPPSCQWINVMKLREQIDAAKSLVESNTPSVIKNHYFPLAKIEIDRGQ